MNDFKTIKQLADELGVSKQTIQKIIEKMENSKKPSKVGNRYRLTFDNQKLIKEILGFDLNVQSDNLDIDSNKSDNHSDKMNIETDKIDNLDIDKYVSMIFDQLDAKDKQIEKLQKLLDQQQILTLQANKKIEELEMRSNEKETKQEEKNVEPNRESEKKSSDSFWKKLFRKEK